MQFNEPQYKRPTYQAPGMSSGKGLVGWVVKKGLAKNEQQANLILGTLGVLMILISLYMVLGSGSTRSFNVSSEEAELTP